MADIERDVPRVQILQRFPFLADWFKSHDYADVDHLKRLMSAEERVERAGGIGIVRSNVEVAKRSGKELEHYILAACNQEPISTLEIPHFIRLFRNWAYAIPTLYEKYRVLEEEDFITRRPVTYIRLSVSSEAGRIYSDWRGYITTEIGLRERARILAKSTAGPSLLERLVPGLEVFIR